MCQRAAHTSPNAWRTTPFLHQVSSIMCEARYVYGQHFKKCTEIHAASRPDNNTKMFWPFVWFNYVYALLLLDWIVLISGHFFVGCVVIIQWANISLRITTDFSAPSNRFKRKLRLAKFNNRMGKLRFGLRLLVLCIPHEIHQFIHQNLPQSNEF